MSLLQAHSYLYLIFTDKFSPLVYNCFSEKRLHWLMALGTYWETVCELQSKQGEMEYQQSIAPCLKHQQFHQARKGNYWRKQTISLGTYIAITFKRSFRISCNVHVYLFTFFSNQLITTSWSSTLSFRICMKFPCCSSLSPLRDRPSLAKYLMQDSFLNNSLLLVSSTSDVPEKVGHQHL